MALMDAGVQMGRPVSGMQMGLISDGDRYAVLCPIFLGGIEDTFRRPWTLKLQVTSEGYCCFKGYKKLKVYSYEIL